MQSWEGLDLLFIVQSKQGPCAVPREKLRVTDDARWWLEKFQGSLVGCVCTLKDLRGATFLLFR